MIKFSLRKSNGDVLIGFGLDGENMARLMSDEPTLITYETLLQLMPPGTTVGIDPIDIVIIGGRDADHLREQVAPLIGPDTKEYGP